MRYVALGARGVGGCCGTTPDDILDMARSVNPLARIQAHQAVLNKEPENPGVDAVPFAERSTFAEKLAAKIVPINDTAFFVIGNGYSVFIQNRKAGANGVSVKLLKRLFKIGSIGYGIRKHCLVCKDDGNIFTEFFSYVFFVLVVSYFKEIFRRILQRKVGVIRHSGIREKLVLRVILNNRAIL
jgi:hypothetical protein